MGLENDLYEELYLLRDEIRQDRLASGRREPQICSDEALREMAQRVPTKLEDFMAIAGVGQGFLDLYGGRFLSVTKKYAVTAARGASMDGDLAQTLRELQKKLVNISKGNRLLYQPKTSARSSFDLTLAPEADVIGLIFGRKRVLNLCDSSKNKNEGRIYTRLNSIMREVNRDKRERGTFDLYVAYPFVEGRLVGDDEFPIRSPLALFPVVLEKEGSAIRMRMDPDRDAVYNNTLILAAMKLSGKNRPLPDNVIDEYEERTFLGRVIEFYGEQGMTIEPPLGAKGGLDAFFEYKADEFPRYRPGEFHLHANAVVGKYTSYSSYIQRDFDAILSKGAINNTLSDLIQDLNKTDFYSDGPLPLNEEQIREKGIEASEKDLMYINSLNSAQENILTATLKEDEIVVQGPPGTGKSQVITGLISAAVLRGETVLMVSEKKTALDVVYSRMGPLSKYCMQIDDTADKERFFKQLGVMVNAPPVAKREDLGPLAESIDADVAKLNNIAEELYLPGDFGIPMCQLYAMDRWLDTNDRGQFQTYETYKKGMGKGLLGAKYDVVRSLHQRFGDPALVRNYREYAEISDRAPWMVILRPDLSEYEISEFRSDLARIGKEVSELNSKSFLSRLFSKGQVARDVTSVVNKYFDKYNNRTIDSVMSDPQGYSDSLDDYDRFASRATVYRSLSEEEREYGRSLLALTKELRAADARVNDDMYRFILNEHLLRFDASRKHIMQELHDFDSIIADMDRKISEKKERTRRILEAALSNDLRYITESKRRGDIVRLVDNKRKWSLNKFLNRYGYEVFKGIKIWLLTPEVVSEIIPMEMGLFDLLVFDEASQMYVERGIPSIYRAKKVVVAGDHKQLRPSSLGTGRIVYDEDEDDVEVDVNSALEEESLLDLARARYDSILLNFHYRSKYEELIAFSNYAFYGGKLYVSPNIEKPEKPPIECFRVEGVWKDRSNEAEAERVVGLLKEIFLNRRNGETVGIIAFNVTQRDLINDRIDEAAAEDPAFGAAVNREMNRYDNGEDVGLFVKNIESVQGDERDVIIFSIGYAKDPEGRFMQRFGWLNVRGGENRLNVAVSRAKRKVYIVSSFEPEELNVEGTKGEGPKILKKYLQYARAISDGDTEVAQAILNSFGPSQFVAGESVNDDIPVMDRVAAALVRKGYNIERNVGIGGYTIDLAVKQDGRFILGIECDSRIYAMSGSTRERDYHRQKYLESRGWHIHRVWTPGMWKDPDAEVAKIVEAIESAQGA